MLPGIVPRNKKTPVSARRSGKEPASVAAGCGSLPRQPLQRLPDVRRQAARFVMLPEQPQHVPAFIRKGTEKAIGVFPKRFRSRLPVLRGREHIDIQFLGIQPVRHRPAHNEPVRLHPRNGELSVSRPVRIGRRWRSLVHLFVMTTKGNISLLSLRKAASISSRFTVPGWSWAAWGWVHPTNTISDNMMIRTPRMGHNTPLLLKSKPDDLLHFLQ